MRRKVILLTLVVVAAFIAVLLWVNGNNVFVNNSGKVRIGVILPLTGSGAIYGDDLKKGIELAYGESPLKDDVELYFEDDAADVTKGINALNSLIFKGIDIVIGGIMSNVANGMLPIVNKEKVLLLSPKATDVNLSREDDYFFRIWPTDDLDGKYSAEYITDSLHLKRIAVFYDNGTYGVGINRQFQKSLSGADVEIVFDEGYESGQSVFRTQIAKIKESDPDVLFLPSYYKDVVALLKQMNEMNCGFYLAGVSSFYEETVKSAAGDMVDKVFFTYPQFSSDSDNPVTMHFVDSFSSRYEDRKPNAFSAHGYDSFKVLERCIVQLKERHLDISADNLKTAMEQMDVYKGATGDLRFDINGDADKSLQILWLKNLQF